MNKTAEEKNSRLEFKKVKESYLESEINSQLHLGGCGINKLLRWQCKENNRYYIIMMGIDLLGQITLIRSWGSLKSKQSGEKREILGTISDSLTENQYNEIAGTILSRIATIFSTRKQHGYRLQANGYTISGHQPI